MRNKSAFNKKLLLSKKDGIIFNKPKKNPIKIVSFRNKLLEKEMRNSFAEYSAFKSNLFIKEKKEKEKEKKNLLDNYNLKQMKRDLTYTKISQLLDIAFNFKNPFKNFDINNKKNEITNLNKTLKMNKINNHLAKIILHESKIKSKVDSGMKKKNELFLIFQKIKNSKNKIEKRNSFINFNNNKFLTLKANFTNNKMKKYYRNVKNIRIIRNSSLNKNNKSANIDLTINNSNISKNISEINRTNMIRSKSYINLNINENKNIDYNFLNKIKNRSRSNNSFYNKRIKFNDNKFFFKNTSVNESMNHNSPLKANSKIYGMKNKNIFPKKILKNKNKGNICKEYRCKSSGSRFNKDKIKYYTNIIDSIYGNYKKIKANSKKLKNKYKEWGFSSYKSIDNFVNMKEDMLIFLLKQKYFKHYKNFPKERKMKTINKSVAEKMKDALKFLDD